MKKRNTKRNVHLTAAAALAAVLITGQAVGFPAFADSDSIQISSMIPENVTITEPIPLYEISLPSSDYGTLSWADDSSVPSERVQSYEVVFRPYDSSTLSKISGWDGESDVIYSSVTVVVSGISGDSCEEDDYSEENYSEEDSDYSEAYEEESSEEASRESSEEPKETEIWEDSEENGEKSSKEDSSESSDISEEMEVSEASALTEEANDENDSKSADAAAADMSENPEEQKETEIAAAADTPEITGTSEAAETSESGETTDTTAVPSVSAVPEEDEDNIFDSENKEIEQDTRTDSAEEDLTEEEQQARAAENHTCAGITVSGISLPWYVQFRVTSGDSYQFSNESEANVFKSYEFELWDLKNNTEYEIPDGEYISVTVPVKAGYEYTIEHLLDSGATETIVPSVDGSTMVFSTHSFSPFGIAGSKSLTDNTIEDKVYVTATPTPVAQTTETAVTGSSASNESTQTTVSEDSSDEETYSDSTEEESSQEDTGNSVNAVYTGDDTPILPFVILGIAAVVIIGVIIYLRKRK